MITNLISMSTRSSDGLIMDILRKEFGSQKVSQALKFKNYYSTFIRDNVCLVPKAFDELSYKWQVGKSKEYLESLDIELQYSLICYLAENYINDKSRSFSLSAQL